MPGSGADSGGRQLQISLTSKNGRTTIRAFEDLKHVAGIAALGIMFGGGFSATMAGMFGIFAIQSPAVGAAAFVGAAATAFGLSRTLYSRSVKRREEELRTTLQRVVLRVQDSLKDPNETPRLPRR